MIRSLIRTYFIARIRTMKINPVAVIAVIIVIVGGAYYFIENSGNDGFNPIDEEVACTLDAKLCPDGSYVGRVPPTCEFSPCPGQTPPDTGSGNIPPAPGNGDGSVACTMEAIECPDGSYVGRTGPNCEFICPGKESSGTGSGIWGTVMLGPTCPVIQNPSQEECADKPYAAKLVVTTAEGSKVIREFSSEADGRFNIALAPGEYAIRSSTAANVLPYCSSRDTFTLPADKYLRVEIFCDSGIR